MAVEVRKTRQCELPCGRSVRLSRARNYAGFVRRLRPGLPLLSRDMAPLKRGRYTSDMASTDTPKRPGLLAVVLVGITAAETLRAPQRPSGPRHPLGDAACGSGR